MVLRWLEVMHPQLPELVGKVFSNELRSKSLKDLQPQILEQVDNLLHQIEQESEKKQASVSYSNLSLNRNDITIYRNDTRGHNNVPKVKICEVCKAAGEPFIGHTIFKCANVAEQDRRDLLSSFSCKEEE